MIPAYHARYLARRRGGTAPGIARAIFTGIVGRCCLSDCREQKKHYDERCITDVPRSASPLWLNCWPLPLAAETEHMAMRNALLTACAPSAPSLALFTLWMLLLLIMGVYVFQEREAHWPR